MTLPFIVFAITITLTLLRPRGWHEAIWPAGAALGLVLFGFVEVDRVVETLSDGASALIFLFALLIYSALIERSGFFDWAALHAARRAEGSIARLFVNFFLLAALITFTLSLDTTAVLLTPIVLSLARQLRISALPFLFMTIFIANAGSLLLPISNLTNILFAERFAIGAGDFIKWMLLPQLFALALLYALLRFLFRGALAARFAPESLPAPKEAIRDRAYFGLSIASLPLIALGYALTSLFAVSPSTPLFAASLILGAYALFTRTLTRDFILSLPWGLFPMVFGLFILVRYIGDAGLLSLSAEAFEAYSGSPGATLGLASLIGLATNLGNNLPIALFIHDVFAEVGVSARFLFAALIGANIGPLLTPFGSLATLLILSASARGGERVPLALYIRLAAFITPALFLGAMGALYIAEQLIEP